MEWYLRLSEAHLEEKPKPRIKVTDRRIFTQDGERREPDGNRVFADATAPPGTETPAAERGREGSPFVEFVLSFAELAFFNLGKIPVPGGGEPKVDIEAAGSMIDILRMLRTKTRGNLTGDEGRVLDEILNQLQMLYLRQAKGGAPEGADRTT